ncbi:hypothetical protein ACIGW1_05890 [Streptomyces sp. NPDC053780]|uniref:hypothetical protein n=1 Tax=unclassified Streptomyces TaxID=2593676 RepID=UPI0034250469
MTRPPYENPERPEGERPGPDLPGYWDPGWEPRPPAGPRPPREPDPLAVAVGNASLLGAGYLMLGRRWLFWACAVVTVALLRLTYATAETWCEVVLLLWWAVMVAHGLWLARRHPAAGPRAGQRVLALGLTLPVLVAAGWVRYDTHGIEDAVAGARARGDCGEAVAAQDGVGFRHRLAAAPVAARGDVVVEVCERLDTAAAYLSTGLTGDLDALETGFGRLGAVLGEPGNERVAGARLTDFLKRLPTEDGCRTMDIADWLRERESGPKALDGPSSATAARIAPGALKECGDALLADEQWVNARDMYQRLLDEHPGDDRADDARGGIRKAGLAIQLSDVRSLVTEAESMSTGYCRKPAKYAGAPAYREGRSRALFVGHTEATEYTDKLPEAWKAGDAADAALVVCADETEAGDVVETCRYRDHNGRIGSVRFNKLAVRVKAYALRTGKLVTDRRVQMGGESCPGLLRYFDSLPSRMAVTPSAADVREAFEPVVGR